jgi:hypothetical protein
LVYLVLKPPNVIVDNSGLTKLANGRLPFAPLSHSSVSGSVSTKGGTMNLPAETFAFSEVAAEKLYRRPSSFGYDMGRKTTANGTTF